MKIAYLIHSYCGYDELIENVNQLIAQGDHVFIMINDNSLREKIYFVYGESRYVHVSRVQEFAQEGDLSMARGTILQLQEAVNTTDCEYFINLTHGMMPIRPRNEIIELLSAQPYKDYYYIDKDEKDSPSIRDDVTKYYLFTNLLSFPTKASTRKFCRINANFLAKLGIKKKSKENFLFGSPWFMLCRKSATILAQNFPYVSETFKYSWYSEQLYIPTMMKKFVPDHIHINEDYRLVGPMGKWQRDSQGHSLTSIPADSTALFAAKISIDENLALYQDYFDIYNK